MQLTRRDFLRASLATAGTIVAANAPFKAFAAQESGKKRWFKGNLHMHNQWSDGNAMPEFQIDWYKSHGYNFVCPSDHNTFQAENLRFKSFGSNPKITPEISKAFEGETSLWKPMSCEAVTNKLTQEFVKEAQDRFGEDSVQMREVGGLTFVRMKTFDELAKQFEESEEFLMIPGFEQTGGVVDKRAVHMNFIGVRKTFPFPKNYEDPIALMSDTYDQGAELYDGINYLFTANHPLWRFYDWNPSALIQNAKVRVFELSNNGIHADFKQHPDGWKPEQFWDVVNAWRASHDQQLLLAMGSDDRHNYATPPKAWTRVRAEKLDQDSLINAIMAGDMYCSNGLDFEDVNFDGKTLEVKIDVQEEGDYRIEFYGTKKDYDPTCKTFETQEVKGVSPHRVVETYSDQIGVLLDKIEGVEGSYTLKSDDLYVRAKIVKAEDDGNQDWRSKPAAWTQPYRS